LIQDSEMHRTKPPILTWSKS